jgi:hypothetical protein
MMRLRMWASTSSLKRTGMRYWCDYECGLRRMFCRHELHRFSCHFSCLLSFTVVLVWARSSIYTDGIKGAIVLSLICMAYLWRSDDYPVSFFASEAMIFFLLSVAAIFCLVSSWDMLVISLSIELQGLCFYTLCVINRSANGATEAAIKYLLMSGLASSLLLFGTSMRYGETGTTNLALWLELQNTGTHQSFGRDSISCNCTKDCTLQNHRCDMQLQFTCTVSCLSELIDSVGRYRCDWSIQSK